MLLRHDATDFRHAAAVSFAPRALLLPPGATMPIRCLPPRAAQDSAFSCLRALLIR